MSNSVYPGCTMSEYWIGRQESDDCEEYEETTMAIQTVTKVLSKSGHELAPKEGFIVQGCIFAAKVDDAGLPCGGLVGTAAVCKQLKEADIPCDVLSKEEMLQALGFTAEELKETLAKWELRK